jgi:hypothetical protein
MRLVVQCSVCGTILPVGTATCGTCRASGILNLRLLFECLKCFRLGLNPECDCRVPSTSLDLDKSMPGGTSLPTASKSDSKPEEKTSSSGVEDESVKIDVSEADGRSDSEPSLDDLPIAELHEEELRLDDESGSVVEEK